MFVLGARTVLWCLVVFKYRSVASLSVLYTSFENDINKEHVHN